MLESVAWGKSAKMGRDRQPEGEVVAGAGGRLARLMSREEALRVIHKKYLSPREAAKQYLRWKSECERKARDPLSPWNNPLCTQEERQWFREYDLRKLEALWVLAEEARPDPKPALSVGSAGWGEEEVEPECPVAAVLREVYKEEIRYYESGSPGAVCRVICARVLGTRQETKEGRCRIRLRLLGIERVVF